MPVVPAALYEAIKNKDINTINDIKKSMYSKGFKPLDWPRLYNQAVLVVNSQDYKFVDLDAKVISKSDDKSYVGCEVTPGHNED